MPPVYNGKKFKANKSHINTSKKIGGTHSFPPCNTLDEPEFKGFRKLPAVVLQRIDISPYTGSTQSNKILAIVNSQPETDAIVKATKQCLNQKCCVKLENSDLNKLREEFLRPISISPEGDQSEIMQSPNSGRLACKICEKVYSNEKKLQNHQENKHMIIYKSQNSKPLKRVSFSDKVIVHELKEYHKCRKCPKIFENYRMLKKHMKLQHKKRKCYICNYCSKKFIDRVFFKVHIKLHCDVCTLLLPNKKSFIDHRRNVCRVLKLFKCKECDETFFRFMDLKDHSYSHTDILLVCDVCKDQFQTKCALAHHLAFLHSKKRPKALYSIRNLGSERLYLCDFCDESSVEKEVIENHIQILPDLSNRAMTGYKDYYFCDQCFKKFDTETEMLTHKWTHFLKVDMSPQKPKGILLNSPNNSYYNGIKIKYRIHEDLPNHFKPTIKLERINTDKFVSKEKEHEDTECTFDENSVLASEEISRPIEDPKSKKTISINTDKFVSKDYSWIVRTVLEEQEDTECSFDENSVLASGEISRPIEDPKSKKTIKRINTDKFVSKDYSWIVRTVLEEQEDTECSFDENSVLASGEINRPIVDPKSKKTIKHINTDKFASKEKEHEDTECTFDPNSVLASGEINKPIVDPKSKKTIISKHQCPNCNKYFSSNYCLNRHVDTQHSDFENLQCKVCEETFVWPSLLRSHKCIRLNHDEMPFDDARPEIHFDNLNEIHPHFDDIPIEEDYLHAVDFDIPTPIVELQEHKNNFEQCTVNNNANTFDVSKTMHLQNLGYKLVMQEVPVEF